MSASLNNTGQTPDPSALEQMAAKLASQDGITLDELTGSRLRAVYERDARAAESSPKPGTTEPDIGHTEWDLLHRMLTQELAMWVNPGVFAEGARCGLEGALTYMDTIASGEGDDDE